MYTIIEIADDIFLLKYSGNTWPTSSNIYAIADRNGLSIIDTGLNKEHCFKGFRSSIEKLGFESADIHTIILTHGHTDHIAGTNRIRKYGSARILLPERSIPEAIDPRAQEHACLPASVREISVKVRTYDILDNFHKTCGEWLLKRDDITPVADGDEVQAGAYSFQAIPAPGHDIGMVVFYEPTIGLLLTADLLKGSGPGNALPWYSTSGGGCRQYLESLDRVEKLSVREAFPSHGSFKGSFAEAVERTRNDILKRETGIIDALRNGPKTCEQLDNILFKPMVLELCPWYSSVTESHLIELEHSGIIRKNGLVYSIAH